ncbi:hypothetical protein MN032_18530 [Agromyces atrinae]|uniref:hypothetical protein n=1 Tax=Agromyces atrinae TaxID=592376 RepID=UPI001F5A7F8A|nr:hypothetical protein [Agromyces atrinae]MCI2959684.1 hypothetical protein [Agromyces atrinae]
MIAADVFETNDPEIAEGLTKKSTLLRTVSAKLKALLIFSVAQVIIDYVGDSITEDVSSYPVSFVQITLAPERPTIESLVRHLHVETDGRRVHDGDARLGRESG